MPLLVTLILGLDDDGAEMAPSLPLSPPLVIVLALALDNDDEGAAATAAYHPSSSLS